MPCMQAELGLGELDGEGALQARARWLPLQANRHGSPVGKDLGRIQARPRPPRAPPRLIGQNLDRF